MKSDMKSSIKSDMKIVVSNEWHVECLSCGTEYYLVEYPGMDYKGCRNCGKNILYVTDHRVKVGPVKGPNGRPVKGPNGRGGRNKTVGRGDTFRP